MFTLTLVGLFVLTFAWALHYTIMCALVLQPVITVGSYITFISPA